MSELRDKIARAIYEQRTGEPWYEEYDGAGRRAALKEADAVLRVLAEHGDTEQVRKDAVTVRVATELLGELSEWSQPVRVRVDETPGVGTGYEMTFQTVDTERAEADLAAARQQLDQIESKIRELQQRHDHCISGYRVRDEQDTDADCAHCIAADLSAVFIVAQTRRILDAPARPAGHDESGQ